MGDIFPIARLLGDAPFSDKAMTTENLCPLLREWPCCDGPVNQILLAHELNHQPAKPSH